MAKGLDFLRKKNMGVCRKTGKTFGELISHLVVGWNESCMMRYADGEWKILGKAGGNKHKRIMSDYRGSITMHQSGSYAGHNGPTAFMMKCKKR